MSMSDVKVVECSREKGFISYQAVNILEWERIEGEKALSFSFNKDTLRKVMGRMLTIVDACIVDPKQNKAMKDLVREVIQDEIEFSSEMAYDQEILQDSISEDFDPAEFTPVTLEEALGVETGK